MGDLIADYIVVGGGLTGCTVASRLSESNGSPEVVLLEAGPDASDNPVTKTLLGSLGLVGSELDYAYQSEPVANTANRVHQLSAGKVLGGGSILNFGGWLRADAADYDEWAEVAGDERWSYKGLRPWFAKSEHFHDHQADAQEHGFDGPMHITSISADASGERKYPLREAVKQAWNELGVPMNPGRKDGSSFGLCEMYENSRDGLRQPSNLAYPLEGVKVFTNTVVEKVRFEGKRATGIRLADGRDVSARKEVILCAGSYRTPQILMLSGIGPASDLVEHGITIVQDSPHVGQNLHDHFCIYFAFRLRDPSLGYAFGSPEFQKLSVSNGFPWDWMANLPLPAEVLEKSTSSDALKKRNLYEVLVAYVPPGIPGIPIDGSHVGTSTMLSLPTSRGTVTIRSSSSNDNPLIRPSYISTAIDRDTIVHAARQTLKVMLSTEALRPIIKCESPPSGDGIDGLLPLTADSSDEQIEERIRLTGTQHYHSGGTAAMGKVVDGEGRVLGVERLRVADASIIPLPLGGHPQATLYAVAEQIASMIVCSSK